MLKKNALNLFFVEFYVEKNALNLLFECQSI